MKLRKWRSTNDTRRKVKTKEKRKKKNVLQQTRMMGLGVKVAHISVVQIFINTNSFSGDFHWFPDFSKSK